MKYYAIFVRFTKDATISLSIVKRLKEAPGGTGR